MNFLDNREIQLENERQNIENIKKIIQENNDLIKKNKELENELKEIKINYQELLSNLKDNSYKKSDISFENSIDAEAFLQLVEKSKKVQPGINKKSEKGIIKSLYKNPPLIGLNNIGATCFINSTLQCLSQTEGLSNYFLEAKNKDRIFNNNIALSNMNENQLSPFYFELIKNLWNNNGPKSFSPYKFINKINEMNSLFKTGQAGDSKDFIIYILEQIHKELKKPINKKNIINSETLNQYDKINAFNHFFSDFQNECSIISDLFFGFTETTNECLNCKNLYNSQGLMNPICYNYQIFNCLIFPLEEVKKMKNNSIQSNNIQMNQNNRVNLYECFFYNQKTELFTGENRNYCNICKQLYDSLYTSKIFISPNVLVLILNRGKGNIYDVKLDFTEIIDIGQFVLQKDKPQMIYNLYGVITHIGQSGPSAHFMAACKNYMDNKWYRFNDAMINPITNIQEEVIEFGTPYILFYQKNN